MMENLGRLLLRLGMGGFMAVHGWGKLMNFGEYAQKFPDLTGMGSSVSLSLAIFGELFCAVAVMGGVFTRLTAIPVAFTMFVAGFVAHAQDPWQKKELAMVYLVAFIAIALVGPGKFSFDHFFKLRKS